MQRILACAVTAGALLAPLFFAAPASAGFVCGAYRSGPFGFLNPERPAVCPYQGDYMVQQWASYDGPAVIAPQPTYAPSRTYVQSLYRVEPAVAIEPGMIVNERGRRVVGVQQDLPRSGKPQVVRANAEVRIYGPERMEIKLYRR